MKQMHILDQMKPEEVAELKAQSVTKTFQRREIIFHKEDTPKYLYVLLEGAVCVFDDTPDGTRNILTIIREPMDCFAEVYLFIDEKLPFSAEAMKKSTVLMIPRRVLHRFPQISRDPIRPVEAEDIKRAGRLMYVTAVLTLLFAGMIRFWYFW